jgi:hypothetical protein
MKRELRRKKENTRMGKLRARYRKRQWKKNDQTGLRVLDETRRPSPTKGLPRINNDTLKAT